MWLGTDGCGLNWVVVVSGPARGQVWILADVGAAPYRAGRPFADWLGDWLAGGPVWQFGSGVEDWLEPYNDPVADVETGGGRVRAGLRAPSDIRPQPGTCGYVEQAVDREGRDAGTPSGRWTTAVGAHGQALSMTARGARLLWRRVRADALEPGRLPLPPRRHFELRPRPRR